ncbi:Transcription initiation factor IIF beta subunit protein [Theileria parva strain Muguga]|uniref:Transcription initiation factor IIF beta subunit protein n=1 Tax=Theileria parva strain Muguga TaxID=333668 RepID=UPI001C61B2E2|nr:Transcription initiation factor IIF beta subunit protein [Theileria parva strain Muguga]EAN30700.2 Transcription initiation factor IIF beta subunit protein [Theileria parva strain Muguga]
METKIPDITLLKVPKFLALQWRNSENHSIIGNCRRNELGELEEFRVNCEGEFRFFKCRKTTLSNPVAVQIDPKSSNLRFIGKLSECLTIFPSLDQAYKRKLKERHICTNVKKPRSTTDETREDPSFDSSETIFKYYNPKTTTVAGLMSDDGSRPLEDTPYNRSRAKSKKLPTMDPDELKLKIFKIFESEEAKDGIQLKRVVQLTGQPLQNVKSAVEEIAIQKRRPTDYKLVYRLKDLYTSDPTK